MHKKLFNFSSWWILPIGLILAIVIAGSLVVQYIRNNTRQEIIKEGESSALIVSIYITSELKKIEGAVQSLAGSPWILPALISRKDQDIEHANSALDRYNSSLGASVSYLMDTHGKALASSNRNAPDSFVGKSYNFRPYFQEAIKGNPGHYFALGITSGKRGFYAGFPVKDRQGKIMGGVAMKKDIAEVEVFFSKYPYCFFINQSGIIFLSSKSQTIFKSLWPIDRETRASLMASQQFGNQPFEAIFPKEITNGMNVVFGGNNYLVSRKLIGYDGWSVVILNPADPINAYIYLVVMATVSACLFVMIFFGIVYYVNRSRKILQQSEERLHQLADATFEGILIHDKGEIMDFNQSALKMLGYEPDEFIRKNIMGFIAPESIELVLRSMQSGYDGPIEVLGNTKDGKTFTIEVSGKPIIFKGKQAKVVAFRDITERKRAEEEMRESEKKYRELYDSLPISIFEIDTKGTIISFNRKSLEVFRYKQEDFEEGMTALQFFESSQLERLGENMQRVIDGTSIPGQGFVFLRKDGSTFPGLIFASTIIQANKIVGIRGAILDITKRKQAEEELQKSEEKYRNILASIEDGYFEVDLAGNFTFVNDAQCRKLGYSREELIGMHSRQYTDEKNAKAVYQLFNNIYKTGLSVKAYDLELIKKDGTKSYSEITASLIRNSEGKPIGFRGISRDVTERKRMEEELREMSLRDQLTGLYNRRGFLTLAEQQLKLSDRTKRRVMLFFVDLDGLKWINDTLGHDEGDKSLMEVASVFKEAFRSSDIIARMGGDEFAILAIDPEEIDPENIINRLQNQIDTRNHQANRKYQLSISIGCSSYDPENPSSIDELMVSADKLMYEQKKNKKSRPAEATHL